MSAANAEESASIVEEYAQLSKQRDVLEAEIAAIADELTSGPNAPGLRGPLIDAEGFPRGDIDVYRVRHQRHAFVCKQNDHRGVMDRIEKLLPQLFEARKLAQKSVPPVAAQPPLPPASAMAIPMQDRQSVAVASKQAEIEQIKKPFAVVESVQDDSPAAWADLRAGDLVLSFGSADTSNHRNLEAIREIVLRNIGSAIRVVVRRQAEKQAPPTGEAVPSTTQEVLELTPQKWSGAGVLGCLLVPFQDDVHGSRP